MKVVRRGKVRFLPTITPEPLNIAPKRLRLGILEANML